MQETKIHLAGCEAIDKKQGNFIALQIVYILSNSECQIDDVRSGIE